MGFLDDVSRKVKAKAEEWDVQGKAEKFASEVDKAAHDAKDKAAEYADDNRSRFREGMDKVGAKIDEQTDGKYADKVARAKDKLDEGVGKLAEQRPGGPVPPTATAATTEATPGYATDTYQPEPYTPDPIDPVQPIDEPVTPPTHAGPSVPQPGTGWPQDAPPKA